MKMQNKLYHASLPTHKFVLHFITFLVVFRLKIKIFLMALIIQFPSL